MGPNAPCCRYLHVEFTGLRQVDPVTMKKCLRVCNLQVQGTQLNNLAQTAMQSWNSSRIQPLLTRQQVCSAAPDGALSIRAGITNPDTLEKILDQIYLSAR